MNPLFLLLKIKLIHLFNRAAKLPTASNIQALSDAPGGGSMVTFTDPEGFPVNLIFGQEVAEKGEYPEKLTINYEDEKPRIRRFQRFQPGPAAVHKVRIFMKASSCTLTNIRTTARALRSLHTKI